MTFKEISNDNRYLRYCFANDNNATYILTSARSHDLHDDYIEKFDRRPSSQWYRRHFQFEKVKQ